MKQITDIKDLRIGDKVTDIREYKLKNGTIKKVEGITMKVVSIFDDGEIYCDFDGNEGDVWEFNINTDKIFKL